MCNMHSCCLNFDKECVINQLGEIFNSLLALKANQYDVHIPTYKVDMDGQRRTESSITGGGRQGKGTAVLQDMSRPIFRRSALENIEGSVVVLLLASWQLYVEWAYPDLKDTPACYFKKRNKGGRRNIETMRKTEIILFIKELNII